VSIPHSCGAYCARERLALARHRTHSPRVRWPTIRCFLHPYEAGCEHEGISEDDSFGAASCGEGEGSEAFVLYELFLMNFILDGGWLYWHRKACLFAVDVVVFNFFKRRVSLLDICIHYVVLYS
jgi:hypothetical protein